MDTVAITDTEVYLMLFLHQCNSTLSKSRFEHFISHVSQWTIKEITQRLLRTSISHELLQANRNTP